MRKVDSFLLSRERLTTNNITPFSNFGWWVKITGNSQFFEQMEQKDAILKIFCHFVVEIEAQIAYFWNKNSCTGDQSLYFFTLFLNRTLIRHGIARAHERHVRCARFFFFQTRVSNNFWKDILYLTLLLVKDDFVRQLSCLRFILLLLDALQIIRSA